MRWRCPDWRWPWLSFGTFDRSVGYSLCHISSSLGKLKIQGIERYRVEYIRWNKCLRLVDAIRFYTYNISDDLQLYFFLNHIAGSTTTSTGFCEGRWRVPTVHPSAIAALTNFIFTSTRKLTVVFGDVGNNGRFVLRNPKPKPNEDFMKGKEGSLFFTCCRFWIWLAKVR